MPIKFWNTNVQIVSEMATEVGRIWT